MTIDKYKSAIIDYAICQNEFKRLTQKIGYCYLRCIESNGGVDHEHIKKAYAYTWKISGWGYCGERVFTHHEWDDPKDYLAEICEHCHAAHLLIQDRKVAKAKFGVAKRRISFLGSRASKEDLT